MKPEPGKVAKRELVLIVLKVSSHCILVSENISKPKTACDQKY